MSSDLLPPRDPAARTELAGRDDVEELVRAFYRDVAMDELLGPIFHGMAIDWPSHIDKLTDFWCWQLFGTDRYDRNPLRAHEPVHDRYPLGDEHYDRWLTTFVATVDDRYVGDVAELAKVRAAKMARAMQRLLDGVHADGADPLEPRMPRRPPR